MFFIKIINPDLNPTPDPDLTLIFQDFDPDLGIVHKNNIRNLNPDPDPDPTFTNPNLWGFHENNKAVFVFNS
jgi:hypothetical protein